MELKEIINIKTGKIDVNQQDPNGEYPFFTCAVENYRINTYAFEQEAVLVAGNGDLNVKYYKGKFNAYQRTYVISSVDESKILTKYLYYFLKNKLAILRKKSKGGVIKYIKVGNITDLIIDIPPIEVQKQRITILEDIEKLINNRENQIEDFKKLLSDTFTEKYLIDNKYPLVCIEELAEKSKNSIKAGPFGSSLKKECYVESGYKIYGQEQVINDNPYFGDYYIDENKYKELYNYSVNANDVLISLVGTYGKVMVVPEDFEEGIINPRLMKIRFDKKKINPYFFKFLFSSDAILKAIEKYSHGGVMSILNTTNVKKIKIVAPPIEEQEKFLLFLETANEKISTLKSDIIDLQQLFEKKSKEYYK